MRRFFTFVFLLSLALPVGISLSGCTSNPDANYCFNAGHGIKKGTLYKLSLTPVAGISLSYGQTATVTQPTGEDCTGASASASSYTYQTDNPNLADISPSGSICAGTWNKFSSGGTPDYTICTPPTTSGVVHLWASASSVSSNKIPVFIHPQISSLVLNNPGTASCISQSTTQALTVAAYTTGSDGNPSLFCDENSTDASKKCSAILGALSYETVNSNVATIDNAGTITAKLPGSTAITGKISNVSSTAGYIAVCPPTNFRLTLPDGSTSGTVSNGVAQSLTLTATDKNGVALSGLTLDYISSSPKNISVTSAGSVSSSYPGTAAIYAFCQPGNCNPSPLDKIGQLAGTGLPIASNKVSVSAAGSSTNYLWLGSSKSQSFVPVNLLTGSVGSAVRLPYQPNSMILDQTGSNIYFGSNRELMVYSATTNSLSSEDINVPGTVLAVSPDNSQVLINDQTRKVFYLYSTSAKTFNSFGGVGSKASFTLDSKTLYIVGTQADGTDTLFVYNAFTGWNTIPLSGSGLSGDLTVTVPHVGLFLSGKTTTYARSYCWNSTSPYPPAGSVAVQTDHIAATDNGQHILGVNVVGSAANLVDIGVASLNGSSTPVGSAPVICPATGNLTFSLNNPLTLPLGISTDTVQQVVASADSSLAFVTYSPKTATAGAALPYYKPATVSGSTTTQGTLGTVTLAGAATAPVAGIFSPNNAIFFVATQGDNRVHYINTSTLTDTTQIEPKLLDSNGNVVPVEFLAVHPRAIN